LVGVASRLRNRFDFGAGSGTDEPRCAPVRSVAAPAGLSTVTPRLPSARPGALCCRSMRHGLENPRATAT
jgi:hypothetical protein